jgi:uncharacterized protein
MMVLELRFDDDPQRLAARPAHRRLLERLHAERHLALAGPWKDDSGALLIFDADEAEVRRIMASDPYYTTPGVRVVALREWSPIIGVPSTRSGEWPSQADGA